MKVNFSEKFGLLENELLQLLTVEADYLGIKLYLLGGCVRDIFLKKEIFDIDMLTEGDAVDFAEYLEAKNIIKIISKQNVLRTVKILYKNSVEADIATTRKENYPQKGFLPVLEKLYCSLICDVKRRDFSINTMAISLNGASCGVLIDNCAGLDDLRCKKIRVLHENSFIDDPTRIVRALKFAVRFNFTMDLYTKKLQDDFIAKYSHLPQSISRLKAELKQAFDIDNKKVLQLFKEDKLYYLLSSALNLDINIDSVFLNIFNYNSEFPRWILFLATFLKNVSESAFLELVDKLSLKKNERNFLFDSWRLFSIVDNLPLKNSALYEILSPFVKDAIYVVYVVSKCSLLKKYLDELIEASCELTGSDLISLGYPRGEIFFDILKALKYARLDGLISSRSQEIEFVKSNYSL